MLLLEPDAGIRELVTKVLQRAGYTVAGTSGGGEALRERQTRRFDALVVDVSIYGSVLEDGARRGLGFLHFLQRTQPAVLDRVIVTSALPEAELRGQLPPVCRVIRKPFDIDELTNAVSECAKVRLARITK
ncbi:MAG TPA: response regulator [Thermoanaerobaculia bacterium]|nr:response regulator [Thermoanaerobaculia bacterium]